MYNIKYMLLAIGGLSALGSVFFYHIVFIRWILVIPEYIGFFGFILFDINERFGVTIDEIQPGER